MNHHIKIKKAFEINLQKDAGSNNYRSRMGFNLYPLPLGTYTIIFEYYFPENTNIQLSCQSTTAYVHKYVQKDFTDYSKLLVQINNNSKATPDYLFFTIHGTAVVSNPEGYIIVYGVKDWSDSVDPSVYDDAFYVQMFKYENGDMQMQTDIDLNNNKIKNIPPARDRTDLLMKQSVKIFNISLYGTIDQLGHFKSNGLTIQFHSSIYISKIFLKPGDNYKGNLDQITILGLSGSLYRTRMRYSFQFSSSSGNKTYIDINHLFVNIDRIYTQTATNIPFYLVYHSLHI